MRSRLSYTKHLRNIKCHRYIRYESHRLTATIRTIFGPPNFGQFWDRDFPSFSDIGRTRDRFLCETGTIRTYAYTSLSLSKVMTELMFCRTSSLCEKTMGRAPISTSRLPGHMEQTSSTNWMQSLRACGRRDLFRAPCQVTWTDGAPQRLTGD